MGEEEFDPIRLVSVYDRDAKEPWYLVTNLVEESPAAIVKRYKRRMWIEALIRDLKNRNWGAAAETLGLRDQLKATTVTERVHSLA